MAAQFSSRPAEGVTGWQQWQNQPHTQGTADTHSQSQNNQPEMFPVRNRPYFNYFLYALRHSSQIVSTLGHIQTLHCMPETKSTVAGGLSHDLARVPTGLEIRFIKFKVTKRPALCIKSFFLVIIGILVTLSTISDNVAAPLFQSVLSL